MVIKIDMTGFSIPTVYRGLRDKLNNGFSIFVVGLDPSTNRRTEFKPSRFDGDFVIASGNPVAIPLANCTHIYIHDFLMDEFGSNKPSNEYAVKTIYTQFADMLADCDSNFEHLFNIIRRDNGLLPANYNRPILNTCVAEMRREDRDAPVDSCEDLLGEIGKNSTLDDVLKEAGSKGYNLDPPKKMPSYHFITVNSLVGQETVNDIIRREAQEGRKLKIMSGTDRSVHLYFE